MMMRKKRSVGIMFALSAAVGGGCARSTPSVDVADGADAAAVVAPVADASSVDDLPALPTQSAAPKSAPAKKESPALRAFAEHGVAEIESRCSGTIGRILFGFQLTDRDIPRLTEKRHEAGRGSGAWVERLYGGKKAAVLAVYRDASALSVSPLELEIAPVGKLGRVNGRLFVKLGLGDTAHRFQIDRECKVTRIETAQQAGKVWNDVCTSHILARDCGDVITGEIRQRAERPTEWDRVFTGGKSCDDNVYTLKGEAEMFTEFREAHVAALAKACRAIQGLQ